MHRSYTRWGRGVSGGLAGALALGVLISSPLARGSVPDSREILVKAHRELELGYPARAAAALEALAGSDLADHAQILRARLLQQDGDLEGAVAATKAALAFDPPSEVAAGAQTQLGRLALQRDDLLGAYRAFRSGWETTKDPRRAAGLALETAQAFDARGLPGDAVGLYRRVWQEWPRSEQGRAAFERDQELTAGIGAEPPQRTDVLDHAHQLCSVGRFEAALRIYDELLTDPELDEALRHAAQTGRAESLFRTRRYPEAIEAYQRVVDWRPKDQEAAIQLARSYGRAGDTQRAIEMLSEITRSANDRTRARARYLVALLLEDYEPGTAARLFRLVEKNRQSPGLARRAMWRLAWRDVRAGRYKSAERRLRPLARGSLWDIEVQRARYWLALSQLKRGDEAGQAGLQQLAESLPLSYYGLRAAERIHTTPALERSLLPDRESVDARSPQRAQTLMDAGFADPAREEVESWVRGNDLSREQRVSAAGLLHGLGDHARAVRLVVDGFGGTFEQGVDPAWRDAWLIAWPRPFGTGVTNAIAEFGADPTLVYAIMREESSYRPGVQSRAGARGLMQIIPPTANRIADALGVAEFDPASLYSPAVNVRFGAFYLNQLLGQFGGSRPLAIAAYNAGPEKVEQWQRRDGELASDMFVESVPYSETRQYLRRVLRSQRMYRLLYTEHRAAPE